MSSSRDDHLLTKALGHVCNFGVDSPTQHAEMVGRIQRTAAYRFAVEPGRVDVFLGFDSGDRQLTEAVAITGEPRSLTSAERAFLSTAVVKDA